MFVRDVPCKVYDTIHVAKWGTLYNAQDDVWGPNKAYDNYTTETYKGVLKECAAIKSARMVYLRFERDNSMSIKSWQLLDSLFEVVLTNGDTYEFEMTDYTDAEFFKNFCIGIFDDEDKAGRPAVGSLSRFYSKLTTSQSFQFPDNISLTTPPTKGTYSDENKIFPVNLLIGVEARTNAYNRLYFEVLPIGVSASGPNPVEMFYGMTAHLDATGSSYDLTETSYTIDELWDCFIEDRAPYTPPEVTPYDQTIVFLAPTVVSDNWDEHSVYYYVYGSKGQGSATSPLVKNFRQ